MKKKGFTLIELLVVISIIAMLMAILMPALGQVKKMAQQLICSTRVRGIGTSMMLYAQEENDDYPIAGRSNTDWGGATSKPIEEFAEYKSWTGQDTASWQGGVSSSLYLLVKHADSTPKTYVCPSSDQFEFTIEALDKSDRGTIDFVEMNDFGGKKGSDARDVKYCGANCVSYSYQFPVGNYSAVSDQDASRAIIADRNPWQDSTLTQNYNADLMGNSTPEDTIAAVGDAEDVVMGIGYDGSDVDYSGSGKIYYEIGNAAAHQRNGQSVLYADGHTQFEKRPDVSIDYDNIYTRWKDSESDMMKKKRTGETSRFDSNTVGSKDYSVDVTKGPKSKKDAFLISTVGIPEN